MASRNGNGKERYTAEDMITALERTKGMVYLAAESLGCSHTTVYNYIDKYATVRQARNHAEGKQLDIAELKLANAIANDEPWAIQFYLRTKGKQRGYTERAEVTGADGGPVQIIGFETVKPEADDEP